MMRRKLGKGGFKSTARISIIVYNGNNCVKQTIEMDTNSRAEQALSKAFSCSMRIIDRETRLTKEGNKHKIHSLNKIRLDIEHLRCKCKEIRKTFYRFMMWQLSLCPFVYKFVNKSLPNLIYLSMAFRMRHMRQFCAFLMSIVIAIDFVTASEQHDDEGR
ncbi:hypothetical protein GQX74_007404 [Glossina fuscipes]|nr:hypothetical protein GQX74_007404 [Glossina fuscipes]